MANPLKAFNPIRKAIGAGVVAAVTTAFGVLNADGFDFSYVSVSQWESVVLAVFGAATTVYGLRNKDGKPAAAAAPSVSAAPVADSAPAPADPAPAAPAPVTDAVLAAIVADWAAATTPPAADAAPTGAHAADAPPLSV